MFIDEHEHNPQEQERLLKMVEERINREIEGVYKELHAANLTQECYRLLEKIEVLEQTAAGLITQLTKAHLRPLVVSFDTAVTEAHKILGKHGVKDGCSKT